VNKLDRFGNSIEAGDVIFYYGTTVGLIVGVVIKFNALSYKVKAKKMAKEHADYFKYYNIPFSSSNTIITQKGMKKFKAEDFLDDLEKLRLDIS